MEIPALSFPGEEANILKDYYKKASSILEYGSGGSTWYAAIHGGKKIVTVESNYEFGNALLRKINAAGLPSIPNIIYEDIGPVGKWGRPIDPSHWNKFIYYALAPWERFPDLEPDVVLIDGRFRTACFATTALSIKRPTIILFDDYVGRPHYHKVEFLARPEKIIGRLAIFSLTPQQFSNKKIKEIFSLLFNAPATTVHEELKTNMGLLSKETNQLVKENAELKKRLKDIEERLGKTLTEYKSSQKIQAELKGDLRRARKKYRKLKRWGLVLSMPSLIALSPVSIPVGIFYSIKQWRRRLKKKNKPVSNALLAPKVSEAASAPKHLVFEAFLLHQQENSKAALALLDKHREKLPAGTRALFESMNATTDSSWLDAMNRWTNARGLPKLGLEEGEKPRFHRIVFPASEKAPAPHLVTVIMPCYNAEETVERSVRSILDQSWQNIELIAVNDASTDDTGSILDEMAKSEPRLKVLHNRINVGPYVSKNLALMQAQGNYITGHDADDIALPNRISMQMGPILQDSECKATIAHMVRLDEHGLPCYPAKISRYSSDGIFRWAFISLLIERNFLTQELGFWDSVRFGGDSEMIGRVTKKLGKNFKALDGLAMLCLFSETGLTGDVNHGTSLENGMSLTRRNYRDSWAQWHNTVNEANLYVPFPLKSRLFEAPKIMKVSHLDALKNINDEQNHQTYDACIITNCNFPGGNASSTIEEINTFQRFGMKTMLIHCPVDSKANSLPSERYGNLLNSIINFNEIEKTINCKVAIIRHPRVIISQNFKKIANKISAQRILFVVNNSGYRPDGSKVFCWKELEKCINLIKNPAKGIYPLSPSIRNEAITENIKHLAPINWPPLFDSSIFKFEPKQTISLPFIIGRHGRDGQEKWISDPIKMKAAYPEGDDFEIRILGGASTAESTLGNLPKNWTVYPFGSKAPADFLKELDFFVYFPHEQLNEAFGRTIMEAIFCGIPCILPHRFHGIFGNLAYYCKPQEVRNLIYKLANNNHERIDFISRARESAIKLYDSSYLPDKLPELKNI